LPFVIQCFKQTALHSFVFVCHKFWWNINNFAISNHAIKFEDANKIADISKTLPRFSFCHNYTAYFVDMICINKL